MIMITYFANTTHYKMKLLNLLYAVVHDATAVREDLRKGPSHLSIWPLMPYL